MNLIRKLLSKISCQSDCVSNCKYNNQQFDPNLINKRISDFKLKNKDFKIISEILAKRDLINNKETYV